MPRSRIKKNSKYITCISPVLYFYPHDLISFQVPTPIFHFDGKINWKDPESVAFLRFPADLITNQLLITMIHIDPLSTSTTAMVHHHYKPAMKHFLGKDLPTDHKSRLWEIRWLVENGIQQRVGDRNRKGIIQQL